MASRRRGNRPGRTVTRISEAEAFSQVGPEDQDHLLRFPRGCPPSFPRQGDRSAARTAPA